MDKYFNRFGDLFFKHEIIMLRGLILSPGSFKIDYSFFNVRSNE